MLTKDCTADKKANYRFSIEPAHTIMTIKNEFSGVTKTKFNLINNVFTNPITHFLL